MLNIPMLILLPLWLALIPFHALAASGLTVKLLDHISEAGLAGQEVHAYEKGGDGSLVWKTKRVTDGGGLAKFDLEGLGEGKTYVFNAQPYGYWVKSEEVTATGWYSFRVGHLQVRVIDGVTEQPKAGQAVVLKRWQADGNHVGVMNATTDAEGWLKLDPPNLGQVGYVVTAISPTDGQWKTSETYWVKGPHRFVLGNAVVEAKLRDGISGEGLAGQWMEVWEKLSTGNRVLREKRWTDGTGSIKFDLAGMKEGRRYVLKAQPYLDAVESGEISQSGPQELKAGKLRITLVDGRDGQGYGWRDVDLLERQADGSLKGVRSYKTDGEGRLRLDPAQLGVKDQVIRAVSLVDGSVKESPGYARGGDYSFKVGGPGLTVKLLDHISEAGLAGQEVHAYEKGGDGSLVWKTKRVTDGGGLAKFDLEGLGEGKTYVFNAQPYGYWVKSEEVTATGWYSFRVGHLQVRVIDGVTEQPKAGQAVVLKRWQADGNHVGVMNATTDAEGWLKLDPPNLGQVGYVVTAISPTDGQWKTSETYWVKGPHRFVLGNAVVEAKLRDGISGEGLAGQWMEVWEKLSTGNRVLREKRWTDGTGSIKFDLAGMKEGRRYVLKAQPYLDAVESGEISQSGPQELKAGKLRITLVDGRDGQGYGWRDVDLLERQADGSLKGVRSYKTDGEGRLRLDPAQLGVKDQVIRAVSLVDGSVKESPGYARGGDYSFKVGGPGLTVKLLDHISEAGLAGQEVHAYEKGGDGSLVWKTKRVTDGGGLAKFDLEGLGEGKTYVFNAQPYGYWVKSEEVTATGWYSFRVGHLQVRVIDGVTEQPKAGQAVVLKRWQADGNHVGVMNATTDAEGWLKLDPPNLGQVGYVVTAISPTDGQWKTSETYWVKGPHRFVLGNAVVEAKLRDGISGEGLAGQWMEVWEKLSTGNRVLREKRWTDGTGSIKFDLAGMKEGRRYVLKAQPYLDAVESGEISQSGPQELKAGKLRITLVDGRDGQGYGWRDVDLLERQADGSLKGVRSYKTDGEGRLRLDPAQLGVKDQVIRAVSLVDGSVKESPGYARGGDYSFKVGGPGLTVKLLDHISEAGLAGQEVHAYEKGGDGSLVWKTKRVTDGGGLAKFDLEGLGEGKTYVFNAQPYGYWVKSEEVTATGWYSFRVGHLQVRVIDGVTEQPKAGQAVVLKRWQADGNHVGVMNATTDAEGWLKLDPPNLGQVGYVVTAISPTDGQWKTSETYWVKGPHRFVLGNAVVEAKLRDGISGEGLAGQWMEVWEKLSTGNRVLREKRWTDGTGSIKFDLAGMKEGRRYVLKAQPYLDAVESGEISQSGPQELKAGKLRITLVDGRDGQGYGWRDVDLLERQADGSLKGVRSYKTDGEGRLRLDPAQLGVKDQVIRAVSLVDGSVKESPGYARGGDYSFKVGGPGLTVKLLDHISEAGLAGQEVHAYEKGGDGSLVWKTKRVTDGGGLAKFDLEGLGEGKTYVFNAQPYGYWVKSEEVTAAGWYSFRVGTTLLTLQDSSPSQPLSNQRVIALEKLSNGNLRWERETVTDAQGQARFDLTGLGKGATYLFKAVNPFGDGKDYFSNLLTWQGRVLLSHGFDPAEHPRPDAPRGGDRLPRPGRRGVEGGLRLVWFGVRRQGDQVGASGTYLAFRGGSGTAGGLSIRSPGLAGGDGGAGHGRAGCPGHPGGARGGDGYRTQRGGGAGGSVPVGGYHPAGVDGALPPGWRDGAHGRLRRVRAGDGRYPGAPARSAGRRGRADGGGGARGGSVERQRCLGGACRAGGSILHSAHHPDPYGAGWRGQPRGGNTASATHR
jgi:hypothetical protein